MKALRLHGVGDLRLAREPAPVPGPGEALVRVTAVGICGSDIPDMKTVIGRLERGELDTNISVDAVTGMEGVEDALAAVEARTTGGKIVVYPALHELGMVRLSEMGTRFPTVARGLRDGRWTRAAEEALLAVAAVDGGR